MIAAVSLASIYWLAALAGAGLSVRIARDSSPVARELLWLAICVAEWSLFYGFETLAQSAAMRELWSQLAYIGTYGTGTFLLRFAIRWLRPRLSSWWLNLLWIVPIAIVIAAFTNQWHGLIWPSITPSDQSWFVWFYEHGPIFWVGISYQYAAILASVVVIISAGVTRRGIYRQQAILVILGVVIAVTANVLYLARVFRLPVDITPISLAFSTGIFYAAVTRARLLDLLPAARHRVVDLMPDGLMVLDEDFRVIDWNQAVVSLWAIERSDLMGVPVAEVIPSWPEVMKRTADAQQPDIQRTTLVPGEGPGEARYMDIEVRRFAMEPGRADGWIVLFHDATDMRQTEISLQEANQRLEALNQVLLRQAIHDGLTGLFNRSYLDDSLPREIARCLRDGSSIALLILDVDHFKTINDTFGHDAGDQVLRSVAELVRGMVRAGDLPCRFGGDEIVAVMPGANEEEAILVAERIRERVGGEHFSSSAGEISVTVSIGVSVFPAHGDTAADLFRAADRALYEAKDGGRNRVVCASSAAE
jgi:diguanylate cyclase (GGDEF)-like protein/PAS domain S-box-containing protein